MDLLGNLLLQTTVLLRDGLPIARVGVTLQVGLLIVLADLFHVQVLRAVPVTGLRVLQDRGIVPGSAQGRALTRPAPVLLVLPDQEIVPGLAQGRALTRPAPVLLVLPDQEIVPGLARSRGRDQVAPCLSVRKVPVVIRMKYPPPG